MPTAVGQYGDEALLSAAGTLLASTAVTVLNPDNSHATLYTDLTGTVTAANPVNTDTKGNLLFFAVPGPYQLSIGGIVIAVVFVGGGFNGGTVTGAATFTAPLNITGGSYHDSIHDGFDPMHPAFGAKGDGVTDDTAAVQAAFNAVPVKGGIVDLANPPVGYKITSAIRPKSNTTVKMAQGTVVGGSGQLNYGGALIWGGAAGVQTNLTAGFTPATSRTAMSGLTGTSLPASSLAVNSTSGFPSSGQIVVGTTTGQQVVSYTSTDATHFLGCSGGSGTTLVTSVGGASVIGAVSVSVISTGSAPSTGMFHVIDSAQIPQFFTYYSKDATHFYGCTGGQAAAVPNGAQVTTTVVMVEMFNVQSVHWEAIYCNGAGTPGVIAVLIDSDNTQTTSHNSFDHIGITECFEGFHVGTNVANGYQMDKQVFGEGWFYAVAYGIHMMSINTQSGKIGPAITFTLVNKGIWIEAGGYFDIDHPDFGASITNFAGTTLPNQPVFNDFTQYHNTVKMNGIEGEDLIATRNFTDLTTTLGSNVVTSASGAQFHGINTTVTASAIITSSPITLSVASTTGIASGAGTAKLETLQGTCRFTYTSSDATHLYGVFVASGSYTVPSGTQVISGDVGSSLWGYGVAGGAIVNSVASTTQVSLTLGLGGAPANSGVTGTGKGILYSGVLLVRQAFCSSPDILSTMKIQHSVCGPAIDIQQSSLWATDCNSYYTYFVCSGGPATKVVSEQDVFLGQPPAWTVANTPRFLNFCSCTIIDLSAGGIQPVGPALNVNSGALTLDAQLDNGKVFLWGTGTITMPALPLRGWTVTIGAYQGNAGPTVINGNGTNIDGAATRTLLPGETATLMFDTVEWNKIGGKSIAAVSQMTAATPTASPASTLTKQLLDTLDIDTSAPSLTARMGDVTNHQIDILRSGLYRVSATLAWGTVPAAASNVATYIEINGSVVSYDGKNAVVGTTGLANNVAGRVLALTSANYVELWTYQDSGSSWTPAAAAMHLLVEEVAPW